MFKKFCVQAKGGASRSAPPLNTPLDRYIVLLHILGVLGLSVTKLRSLSMEKIKSVNIWQSYNQEGDCLAHFVRLATTLLKDEVSAYATSSGFAVCYKTHRIGYATHC